MANSSASGAEGQVCPSMVVELLQILARLENRRRELLRILQPILQELNDQVIDDQDRLQGSEARRDAARHLKRTSRAKAAAAAASKKKQKKHHKKRKPSSSTSSDSDAPDPTARGSKD